MSQSKKQSIFESVIQTLIGLATSILVQITIYPLMGIPVTFSQNLVITTVFFVVSMIRGYLVRRCFNLKQKKCL
jgi:high-affinity Fe2+/Pb2+ permease